MLNFYFYPDVFVIKIDDIHILYFWSFIVLSTFGSRPKTCGLWGKNKNISRPNVMVCVLLINNCLHPYNARSNCWMWKGVYFLMFLNAWHNNIYFLHNYKMCYISQPLPYSLYRWKCIAESNRAPLVFLNRWAVHYCIIKIIRVGEFRVVAVFYRGRKTITPSCEKQISKTRRGKDGQKTQF